MERVTWRLALSHVTRYEYAHDEADAVTGMDCLPPSVAGRKYYRPTDRGFEKEIRRRLEGWDRIKASRRRPPAEEPQEPS